jgi:NADH dehydrogenase FAD-containing subunit
MRRIVIVGAGFAGLAAAKALRHAEAEVFVVDRANHNLFQPLLYQVATTVLSPAQIASPIRGLLMLNTPVFSRLIELISYWENFSAAKIFLA